METQKKLERVKTPGGFKWILPTRDTSQFRPFGWSLIAIGILGTAFMLFWIGTPMSWGVSLIIQKQPFGWLMVAFAMLGMSGLFYSLRFLSLGIKILRNTTSSEIEIRNDRLIAIEKLGWFDWRRKIAIDDITSFQVVNQNVREKNEQIGFLRIDHDVESLAVETGDGHKKPIALLHSPEFLEALAHELAAALADLKTGTKSITVASLISDAATPNRDGRRSDESIPVLVGDKSGPLPPTRPANCKIVELQQGDGMIGWEVPPTGFNERGSRFLLLFGLCWTALSSFMLVAVIYAMFTNPFSWGLVGAVAFVLVFVLIGVGVLIAAVYSATMRVLIGVVDGQLFIERKTKFNKKLDEFAISRLSHISVGPSGVEVNDQPVMELKLNQTNGQEFGFLGGHAEPELQWFAYHLNDQLNLKKETGTGVLWQVETGYSEATRNQFESPETIVQLLPAESRLKLSTGNPLQVSVPRHGLFRGIFGLLTAISVGVMPLLIYIIFVQDKVLLIFGAVFAAISMAIVISILVYCWRRFEIQSDGHSLTIQRIGLFGQRIFQWTRRDLKSIDLEDSGTKINNRTMWQLKIQGDSNVSLMMGWSRKEIAVVAALLNQSMGTIVEPQPLDEHASAAT